MAKFRPGGPRPLRSPHFLEGFPDLSPEDLLKVQTSTIMLCWREQLLVCLSFMAQADMAIWSSLHPPCLGRLLRSNRGSAREVARWCSLLRVVLNWHKSWLFASSFPPLSSMACVCSHGQGAHESVTGIGPDGEFRSRKTGMYPPKLASDFASIIHPLLSSGSASLSVSEALFFSEKTACRPALGPC